MFDDEFLFEQLRQAEDLELHSSLSPDRVPTGVTAEDALQQTRLRIVTLPDGDVHVCDDSCEYRIEDKEGYLFCELTGITFDRTIEVRTDCCTGRASYNVDADAQVTTQMEYCKWKRRRSMAKDSESAFIYARGMDDTQMDTVAALDTKCKVVTTSTKYVPKCVDDSSPNSRDARVRKRVRISRREVTSISTMVVLRDEAEAILNKLIKTRNSQEHQLATTSSSNSTVATHSSMLYKASLQKYLKECCACSNRIYLNEIHDIALVVRTVTSQHRVPATCSVSPSVQHALLSHEFKTWAISLILSLWSSVCHTGYLIRARRGAGSFQSFCAGVVYGFKRGTLLSDGTIVIPCIPHIMTVLPTMRQVHTTSALKTLVSNAHRGICTLHKTLGTISVQEAHVTFNEALKRAQCVPNALNLSR